jgi:hypothetical protein
VRVAEHVLADAVHHGTVPLHERREGQLGGFSATDCEYLQELDIGKRAECTQVE